MKLIRRLARSEWLASTAGLLLSLWSRFCHATTSWQIEGRDAMLADQNQGAIVVMLWHADIAMTPLHWPPQGRKAATFSDPSPAGSVGAAYSRWFGGLAFRVRARKMSPAELRPMLRAMQQGYSLCLTADGPKGPPLKVRNAVFAWVRIAKRPVWIYTSAVRSGWHANSWDHLQIPRPFTRGTALYRRWDHNLTRNSTDAALEAARQDLEQAMLNLRAEALARVASPSVPPPPR